MEGDVRRDQIAQAVLALAAEEGTSAVSIAAVAHRIGVAPSALYRHYPSKDAMLAGTIERLAQAMLGNVARARAAAPGPVETLERLLMLQIELIRDHRGLPFLIFSEGSAHAGEHRTQFREFILRFRSELAALFREGQETGQVRADVPAETLAVSFIGLYVPPAILWNLTRGRFDITAQARRAWTIFHDGIRPRTGSGSRAGGRVRAPRAPKRKP
jgi:AcrR family transcriptional regulator